MTDGASSASPGCDRPDRLDEVGRRDVLEQEPARAGPERLDDVLVGVERGEDEDPRLPDRARRATIRRVASTPSMTGIRMSMTMTSGSEPGRERRPPALPFVRLADDLDVRLVGEDHPEPGPDQLLVVDEQDPDRAVASSTRSRASGRSTASPAPGSRARSAYGLELPAEHGHPLAHPDQAVARARRLGPAAGRIRPPPAVVVDLDLERGRAVADRDRGPRAGACLRVLVSASWMIR